MELFQFLFYLIAPANTARGPDYVNLLPFPQLKLSSWCYRIIYSKWHSHRRPAVSGHSFYWWRGTLIIVSGPCNIYAKANYGICFWIVGASKRFDSEFIFLLKISDNFSMLRTPSATLKWHGSPLTFSFNSYLISWFVADTYNSFQCSLSFSPQGEVA